MRLGIRNSVQLIASLCRHSSVLGAPFCVDSSVAERLQLPTLEKSKTWESIAARLAKLEIVGVEIASSGFRERDGYLFYQQGTRFVSPEPIRRVMRIVADPKKNYSNLSETSKPLELSQDRNALEREAEILATAAEVVSPDRRAALAKCAKATHDRLDELNAREKAALTEVGFDAGIAEINQMSAWPGDMSDREYAQYRSTQGLLEDLVKAGIPATRARALIVDATGNALFKLR